MNTQPITDAPYEVGNNPELDEAIVSTLLELTPCWQSFACDPMPETKRVALQRLVLCGFAKMRLTYKVTNNATGDWKKLRYVLSGNFLENGANELLRFHASQCPRDWFADDHVTTQPGVTATPESNDWTVASTGDWDKLRKLPDNRWHVLNTVCCHNERATILKDGIENGRDASSGAVPVYSRHRRVDEWLTIFKSLGQEMSEDTFLRRRTDKAVPKIGVNPISTRSSISLLIADLPTDYMATFET